MNYANMSYKSLGSISVDGRYQAYQERNKLQGSLAGSSKEEFKGAKIGSALMHEGSADWTLQKEQARAPKPPPLQAVASQFNFTTKQDQVSYLKKKLRGLERCEN